MEKLGDKVSAKQIARDAKVPLVPGSDGLVSSEAEALAIADRAYVLQTGRIVMQGPAAAIAADDAVRRAYLGM